MIKKGSLLCEYVGEITKEPSSETEFLYLGTDMYKRKIGICSQFVANEARLIAGIPKRLVGKENC